MTKEHAHDCSQHPPSPNNSTPSLRQLKEQIAKRTRIPTTHQCHTYAGNTPPRRANSDSTRHRERQHDPTNTSTPGRRTPRPTSERRPRLKDSKDHRSNHRGVPKTNANRTAIHAQRANKNTQDTIDAQTKNTQNTSEARTNNTKDQLMQQLRSSMTFMDDRKGQTTHYHGTEREQLEQAKRTTPNDIEEDAERSTRAVATGSHQTRQKR